MADFRPPHVELGMPVIWYHEGNRNCPHAMIVTAIGERGIDGNILAPDTFNTRPVSGVPHVNQPNISQIAKTENGTWEHSPWMKFVLKGYMKEDRVPPQTKF